MEFIGLLSSGKETWGQISGLIKHGDWEKIIIIGDSSAKDFASEKKFEFIQADTSLKLIELKKELLDKLKSKINGTEVALSIASGNGKEHMALISALLSIPAGIRFTALTKDGVVFL